MPIADPNSKKIDLKPRFHVRVGKKLFKVVSSTRGPTDEHGNPIKHDEHGRLVNQWVRVRCVVVKDLERDSQTEDPPNDFGMSCDARLWNTERGAAMMARFARGLKYMQAFDTDDDVLWLEKIISSNDGVFVGTVKVDSPTVDGKVRHYAEIESFAPYEGEKDLDAWQALADRSYEEQAKAIEERAKREKRGGGGGYGGGKRRGSGTSTGAEGEDLF